jgi:hypothetical protein
MEVRASGRFRHRVSFRIARRVRSELRRSAATEDVEPVRRDRCDRLRQYHAGAIRTGISDPKSTGCVSAAADAIFAVLDPSGTGSVSKQDFVSTMSKLMVSLRAEGSAQCALQPSTSLAASLQSLNQIDPTSVSSNSPPGTLLNYSV